MFDFIKSIPTTLGLSVLALIVFAFPELAGLLEYDTSKFPSVQPLQWLGCHLLHWTSSHLFWDLGMFALLGGICERISPKRTGALLLIAALVIPVAVAITNPDLGTYRGLSGLDTALFSMATICLGVERLRDKDTGGVLLYVGLFFGMALKIYSEVLTGSTMFVESSQFTPVPVAHVAGALAGCLVGAVEWGKPGSSKVSVATAG